MTLIALDAGSQLIALQRIVENDANPDNPGELGADAGDNPATGEES